MKIIILDINESEIVKLPKSNILGYNAEIMSDLFTGRVIIIPAKGAEMNLKIGNEIFVEASVNSYSNLSILGSDNIPKIETLEVLNDYKIQGKIISLDVSETLVIKVGELSLMLDISELSIKNVKIGDWISITAHKLTFWDSNI